MHIVRGYESKINIRRIQNRFPIKHFLKQFLSKSPFSFRPRKPSGWRMKILGTPGEKHGQISRAVSHCSVYLAHAQLDCIPVISLPYPCSDKLCLIVQSTLPMFSKTAFQCSVYLTHVQQDCIPVFSLPYPCSARLYLTVRDYPVIFVSVNVQIFL